MRPLISYEDLTNVRAQDNNIKPSSPPKKRRKTNRSSNRKSGGSSEVHAQAQRNTVNKPQNGIQQHERYLTHEDIWDDSALIEAWNAAAEEYEVLNGPDKQWKAEPVNKSALWYNIPPKPKDDGIDGSIVVSAGMPSIPAEFAVRFESSAEMEEDIQKAEEDQENSRPIDFDTFVPQHDPSLPLNQSMSENSFAQVVPSPPTALFSVSVDQAFQNAAGAWYWAGYWTGIYHANSQKRTNAKVGVRQDDDNGEIEDQEDEIEDNADAITEEIDLIPT